MFHLTTTELNVLRMMVGRMSDKEISFALDVSDNTVKTHVENILGKIGVSTREAAVALAIKHGLVKIEL